MVLRLTLSAAIYGGISRPCVHIQLDLDEVARQVRFPGGKKIDATSNHEALRNDWRLDCDNERLAKMGLS